MTPAQLIPQILRNGYEVSSGHFLQAVVIDNSPTIGCAAPNDIARRRLIAIFTADAVSQVSGRLERGFDLLICR